MALCSCFSVTAVGGHMSCLTEGNVELVLSFLGLLSEFMYWYFSFQPKTRGFVVSMDDFICI